MNDVYPGKKLQMIVSVFLIPSFLYWTSGLHKEGLIFLGFSLVIFNFYFGLKKQKFPLANMLFIVLGLLIVLVFRNFLIIILIPALVAWFFAFKFSKKPLTVFSVCYIFFVISFFAAKYISTRLDFPEVVVTKQKEFVSLHGNSSVPMKKLEPNFASFVINMPQTLSLSILRPYPSDVRHILSLAAATETNWLLLLFLIFLVFPSKKNDKNHAVIFVYFCLFLSFSVLITIGYSVNNIGAIVRYRSIILPLLLTPLFCRINWQRINKLVFNNINIKNNIVKTNQS